MKLLLSAISNKRQKLLKKIKEKNRNKKKWIKNKTCFLFEWIGGKYDVDKVRFCCPCKDCEGEYIIAKTWTHHSRCLAIPQPEHLAPREQLQYFSKKKHVDYIFNYNEFETIARTLAEKCMRSYNTCGKLVITVFFVRVCVITYLVCT